MFGRRYILTCEDCEVEYVFKKKKLLKAFGKKCPKCGKFELNFDRRKNNRQRTVSNCRDGWRRPIQHYLCECGNPLAGDMNIAEIGDEDGAIEYAKDVIIGYNKGGIFFQKEFLEYAKVRSLKCE